MSVRFTRRCLSYRGVLWEVGSVRSKRFRLVSEQRKTEERDFWFWPREKWNETQKMFYLSSFSLGLWLSLLVLCSWTARKRLLRRLRGRGVGNPWFTDTHVLHNEFSTIARYAEAKKKKKIRRNKKRKERLVRLLGARLCTWWQLRSMKCNREHFSLSLFYLDNIVTDINSTVFLLRISGMVNSSRDWSPPRATLEISPVFCARWMMWSHSSSDRKFGISWNEKHW